MENDPQTKMKRFIGYLAYILVLGYLTSLAMSLPVSLKLKGTTDSDLTNLSIFYFVYPLILGFLFAAPRFIRMLKYEGIWHFDLVKCLAIGIPTFIWNVNNSLFWVTSANYPLKMSWLMPYPLSGIVLGFILLDSVKKI